MDSFGWWQAIRLQLQAHQTWSLRVNSRLFVIIRPNMTGDLNVQSIMRSWVYLCRPHAYQVVPISQIYTLYNYTVDRRGEFITQRSQMGENEVESFAIQRRTVETLERIITVGMKIYQRRHLCTANSIKFLSLDRFPFQYSCTNDG